MKKFIFSLCFFKLSLAIAPSYYERWIIHDVGQGQWVTLSTPNSCLHFDFGGEKFKTQSLKKIFLRNCGSKRNELYLSHADLDHYSFYKLILQNSSDVCWQFKPQKFKLLDQALFCDTRWSAGMIYSDYYHLNKNASSAVFVVKGLLLTGDSPTAAEKKWSKDLRTKVIRVFMLGHHGSSTSTSEQLLSALKNVKMGISSARFKRYGHPHRKVISKLKAHQIPLLRTEDWGHLMLQIY